MTEWWRLSLWPTTRSSRIEGETELDYQWSKDGDVVSQTRPVIDLSAEDISAGKTLEIYFSYHRHGHHTDVVPDGHITASLLARDGTPQLELVSAAGTSLEGGFCKWTVELGWPPEETCYTFRVQVTTTSESGDETTYTVDPEMVIQPTGPPPEPEK